MVRIGKRRRCLDDGSVDRIPMRAHRKPVAVVVVDAHSLDLLSRRTDAGEIFARQLETHANGLIRELKPNALLQIGHHHIRAIPFPVAIDNHWHRRSNGCQSYLRDEMVIVFNTVAIELNNDVASL